MAEYKCIIENKVVIDGSLEIEKLRQLLKEANEQIKKLEIENNKLLDRLKNVNKANYNS